LKSEPAAVSFRNATDTTINGFFNHRRQGDSSCGLLSHQAKLQVLGTRDLTDDLEEIAEELKDHPMIDYTELGDHGLSKPELIKRTWVRLAQSSVWLEEQQVYFAVSRIVFYTKGVLHWGIMSFLRGQIFDESWTELRNYTLRWQDQNITFPKTFDIEVPYEAGGCFYGPEDPRIIIEQGVRGAEPVIVFNMLSNLKLSTRTMHAFRPFSNAFTTFSMRGRFDTPQTEKNWAPFFLETPGQYPSNTLHFIYDIHLFKVIKCSLQNGWCTPVYAEKEPDPPRVDYGAARMSGGTNLVPVPGADDKYSYLIAFPRTHISSACGDQAMYRPELIIVATDGKQFFIHYVSGPTDFGGAAMPPTAPGDPCGEGRILIVNSISRWHFKNDIMELAYTVDDRTTQVLTLAGVGALVANLSSALPERIQSEARNSQISQDILVCAVKAAEKDARTLGAKVNGTDLRKAREEKG
jgi:beta-1,2-mannosyltransferase